MTDGFDPAAADAWITRGRRPEHAAILAKAWQDFPDLASDAPLASRMARTRERVAAMRPVMVTIAAEQEQARQARDFAFTERRAAEGVADERELAILRGRKHHGIDWDACVHYAAGWYAAMAGWEARPPNEGSLRAAAYARGFRDGGGNPDDLFDAARRQLSARSAKVMTSPSACAAGGHPPPSRWPLPSDAPRPALWERRLLILGAPEAGAVPGDRDGVRGPSFLELVRERAGAERMTVIIIAAGGFLPITSLSEATPLVESDTARLVADREQGARLTRLLGKRDFTDILVAAQGSYLAVLDAHARALSLCRVMERTRNSPRQQRAHFPTWITSRNDKPAAPVCRRYTPRRSRIAPKLSMRVEQTDPAAK